MKKMLALVVLSIGLIGCSEKPKTYICGNDTAEVTRDYIKFVKGKNAGDIIDGIGDNKYKLFTPFGFAYYTVNENTIDITLGTVHHTLTCEVK